VVRRLWLCLLLLPALAFVPSSSGQAISPGQPPTFEGDEVTVAGRRRQAAATTPAYVTVIGRDEIRRMGAVTVADAVSAISEVYVRTAGAGPGGSQQVSVRGSTPQQVLVLFDGVPLNATQPFGVNLSSLSVANVERIEVLRGPYSAIYGSGALGGVISITTRRDTRTAITVGARSDPAGQWAARAGGAGGAWSWAIMAEALATAGERRNEDAQRYSGAGWLRYEPDPSTSLTLSVNVTSATSGLPGSTLFPTPEDRLRDGRTVYRLAWRRADDAGGFRELRVWHVGDEFRYRSPGFQSDTIGATWGAEWQHALALGGGVLTWGIDWQHARYDYRELPIFTGAAAFVASTTTTAAYVQYDFAAGDATLIGIGLRYDAVSSQAGQWNPRLGFVHFLTPELRLRGGVGRTFRAPTFGELFYPSCSDPGLRPESAWAADFGIEAAPSPNLLFRLNTFYTDARDLIIGGCAPRNIGSAPVFGFSGEVAARLGDPWSIDANLTWSDGVDRASGEPILRLPPVTANAALRYLLSETASVSLIGRFVSQRPDLNFSTFPATRVEVASHLTVGVRFDHRAGDLRISAGVDNLFDAGYETLRGYLGPRRSGWITLGIEYR